MGIIPAVFLGRVFTLSSHVVELFNNTPSVIPNTEIKQLDRVQIKFGVYFRIRAKIKGQKYYWLELSPAEGKIKPFGGAIHFKDHIMQTNVIPVASRTKIDRAMVSQSRDKNGGIDFNADGMQLRIHKDARGVQMRFDPAAIKRLKSRGFDGLEFNIQSIVPLFNLPLLLGLESGKEGHITAATSA